MSNRILVIEDDAPSRRLLRAILQPEGFELVMAPDAAAGLKLAAAGVDLVLLDLRLPDLNGLEVLKRLRSLNRRLPVIILTAFGELKTAVEATKLGAVDYLSKPLEHEQLSFAVRRALETSELRAEVEKLRHGAREEAIRELKLFFILQKIATEQNVDVDENELNGRVAMIAAQRGERPEKLKQKMAKDGTLANLYVQMREQKAVDVLLETATIEDVDLQSAGEEKKAE